jgi:hypothetical protein
MTPFGPPHHLLDTAAARERHLRDTDANSGQME